MNADVEKAVESVRAALNDWAATYASEFCDESAVSAAHKRISGEGTLGYICVALASVDTIKQALRDQEAEIARLREVEEGFCVLRRDFGAVALRSSDSEALLRETLRYLDPRHYSEIIKRITAHLGATQHD